MDLSVECVNIEIGFMSNLNKNLYLNDKKADVFFVCGAEKERIPAHKLILSEVSEVFNELFYGQSADESNAIVTLPKTSPEGLKDFLQLFYMDKVNFRIANKMEIIGLTETFRVPNQRLRYELNHVPEQNTPGHILEALNDDCIQAIFRKLKIEDYLNAAKVCRRFQYNAKSGLPPKFRRLDIQHNDRHDTGRPAFKRFKTNNHQGHASVMSQTFAAEFLGIFGSLVHSIHCRDGVENHDNSFLNMIGDLCGKTLIELICDDDLDLNTRSSFTALQHLDLYEVNVSNFNLYAQLTRIKLTKSSNLDFTQPFPNLVEAIFIRIDLTSSQLGNFLQLNRQLRHLTISLGSKNLPLWMYEHIVNFGENLERFTTCCDGGGSDEMMQLSKLRKLKAVVIQSIDIAHLNRLIDHFIQNDVHIDELNVKSTNVSDTNGILKLRTLKSLTTERISETKLLHLVKNMPQLEKLDIKNDSWTERVTPKGIMDILKMGKNLIEFSIAFYYFQLDLEEYQELLALAKDRSRVKIFAINRNVPPEALNSNSKWLTITSIPETYRLCEICTSIH